MIAEIIPESYDVAGRKVFRPDTKRRSGFRPTFPIGRYLSQPLAYHCTDMLDLWRFLVKCDYVSDEEQFGRKDYWQPPEEFEKTKKGDCEDFSLWCWRQLLEMGYAARFVIGQAGKYGEGHAWVTFEKDAKNYLLEPLSWPAGLRLPRLSVIRYYPRFSVSWDGHSILYYEHQDMKFHPSAKQVLFLVSEWTFFWTSFWLKIPLKIGRRIIRRQTIPSRAIPQ